MAAKPMKIPGPDHPISIEANLSRVVVTVGGQVAGEEGVRPLVNRADEVRTLKVEPGG